MQRPDVRIIDNQQETVTDANISQLEAEALLYKYGFRQSPPSISQPQPQQKGLTFDEMVRKQEAEERRVQEERHRKMYGPKAITFDSDRINYSETKYSSVDINGGNSFDIKVQIVTDMKI